jgi:hypothetical protein
MSSWDRTLLSVAVMEEDGGGGWKRGGRYGESWSSYQRIKEPGHASSNKAECLVFDSLSDPEQELPRMKLLSGGNALSISLFLSNLYRP